MSDTISKPAIKRHFDRREALKLGAFTAATGTAFTQSLGLMNAAVAQDANDYKALVCVFLHGGNDQSNLVIPTSTREYSAYFNARPSLALQQSEVLSLSPRNFSGPTLGMHPSMVNMRRLFNQGHVALQANVGTLAFPVTKAEFEANSRPLPFQLFSHSDQQGQWQTGIPDASSRTGWMGRIADLLVNSYNATDAIPISMSIAGNNMMQVGANTIQYQMSTQGALYMGAYYGNGMFWRNKPQEAVRKILLQERTHLLEAGHNAIIKRAITNEAKVNLALEAATPLRTVFPDTYLGEQARIVSRLIGVNRALGQKRQIFFIAIGGWDFHDDLLIEQADRLSELDGALNALYNATVELGLANNVTTFTASDFGRALQHNGRGSDHGWGAHHLVMGGAVQGRRVYGQWPDVALDAATDAGQGRLIPTTAVDQYAATLARWFGVPDAEIATIMPNISRFATSNLGFMG